MANPVFSVSTATRCCRWVPSRCPLIASSHPERKKETTWQRESKPSKLGWTSRGSATTRRPSARFWRSESTHGSRSSPHTSRFRGCTSRRFRTISTAPFFSRSTTTTRPSRGVMMRPATAGTDSRGGAAQAAPPPLLFHISLWC